MPTVSAGSDIGEVACHLPVGFVAPKCVDDDIQRRLVNILQVVLICMRGKGEMFMWRIKSGVDTLLVSTCVDSVPSVIFKIDGIETVQVVMSSL